MKNEKPKLPLVFRIFEILGPLLAIPGLICFIIFMCHPGENMTIFTVSMVCFPIGVLLTFIGYMPLIARAQMKMSHYVVSDNKETLKGIADTQADIHSDAAGTIAKATVEGAKEGLKETMYCKYCGQPIDKDSKFCKHCGKEQ